MAGGAGEECRKFENRERRRGGENVGKLGHKARWNNVCHGDWCHVCVKSPSDPVSERGSRPEFSDRQGGGGGGSGGGGGGGGSSHSHNINEDLLIAVIFLGITAFVLILIIIYGYCKYVRVKKDLPEDDVRGRSSNMRESTGATILPPVPETPELIQHTEEYSEVPQPSIPVKTRKRSMTFRETDEECRKYREDMASAYPDPVPQVDGSRKKSVVTFLE